MSLFEGMNANTVAGHWDDDRGLFWRHRYMYVLKVYEVTKPKSLKFQPMWRSDLYRKERGWNFIRIWPSMNNSECLHRSLLKFSKLYKSVYRRHPIGPPTHHQCAALNDRHGASPFCRFYDIAQRQVTMTQWRIDLQMNSNLIGAWW